MKCAPTSLVQSRHHADNGSADEGVIEKLAIRDRLKQYLLNCSHVPYHQDAQLAPDMAASRPDSLNPLKEEIAHAISDRIPVKKIAAMVDDRILHIREECTRVVDRHSVQVADVWEGGRHDRKAISNSMKARSENGQESAGPASLMDVSEYMAKLSDMGLVPDVINEEGAVQVSHDAMLAP